MRRGVARGLHIVTGTAPSRRGIESQFLDHHLRERRTYESVDHPHLGTEWVYGMPWIFSETPGEIRTAAPLLGEHNQYILCGLLGLTQDRLRVLETKQAVY